MIFTTRYDIFLNFFLCVIDMCILLEFMNRMYGQILKNRKAAAYFIVFGMIFLMVTHSPYDNSFFIFPVSFFILWAYPKNPKKKLLFETCLCLFGCFSFSYL